MKTFVAFSGGKDSTALALLLPDAVPIFTDTVWEHAPLYEHIARFESATGRRVERVRSKKYADSLPEYIEAKKFLPNFQQRFCTRIFKIEAMNDWLQDKLPCCPNDRDWETICILF